ncbi:MAG TPA: hypothetical protein VGQ99_09235 [Tepidisphaeraceae bacterium]|jgi:hypothetical protein|nr:hypothetical protein [Tepidisphaeraceae bacterium]
MRRLAICGLTAFVALLFCSAAHAALIAQFTGVTPLGPNFSYNYNLLFSTQNGVDRLEAGSGSINPGAIGSKDFITLYDVAFDGPGPGANFVSATAGSGFSISLQHAGINAAQTVPLDDLSLANITYSYDGPTITTDTVFPGFSIVVNSNDGTTLKQFTGQYTDNAGPEVDTKVSEIGLVAVPKTSVFIPEPSSIALGAFAVLSLLSGRKLRR